MSLQALKELVPPPSNPKNCQDSGLWTDVCDDLGMRLPEELREFAITYGDGIFQGDMTTRFWIYNPLSPDYLVEIDTECERLRDANTPGDIAIPYPIYPRENGVLPLGKDDVGTRFHWKANTNSGWSIIVMWDWYADGSKEYTLSLTDFLVELLQRRILFEDYWPEPWFADNIKFEPL